MQNASPIDKPFATLTKKSLRNYSVGLFILRYKT
nr:MAG TPA: hypothetical protein [Caudoviricetes sp.]